jgi:hypothetical protein
MKDDGYWERRGCEELVGGFSKTGGARVSSSTAAQSPPGTGRQAYLRLADVRGRAAEPVAAADPGLAVHSGNIKDWKFRSEYFPPQISSSCQRIRAGKSGRREANARPFVRWGPARRKGGLRNMKPRLAGGADVPPSAAINRARCHGISGECVWRLIPNLKAVRPSSELEPSRQCRESAAEQCWTRLKS